MAYFVTLIVSTEMAYFVTLIVSTEMAYFVTLIVSTEMAVTLMGKHWHWLESLLSASLSCFDKKVNVLKE